MGFVEHGRGRIDTGDQQLSLQKGRHRITRTATDVQNGFSLGRIQQRKRQFGFKRGRVSMPGRLEPPVIGIGIVTVEYVTHSLNLANQNSGIKFNEYKNDKITMKSDDCDRYQSKFIAIAVCS
jgi:hypothetical protein